jgi:hypothetical protein
VYSIKILRPIAETAPEIYIEIGDSRCLSLSLSLSRSLAPSRSPCLDDWLGVASRMDDEFTCP